MFEYILFKTASKRKYYIKHNPISAKKNMLEIKIGIQ